MANQNDDWENWGSNNGWNDAPQDTMSWDSNQDSSQNVNMTSSDGGWDFNDEQSNNFISNDDNQDEYWANQESYQPPNMESQNLDMLAPPVKFGSKTIAIILAGAFIILALILLVFNSIHIKSKNPNDSQPQSTNESQQDSEQNINVSNDGFIEIPNNFALDYSGDIYEVSGTVKNKVKYKDGKQVVYCLVLYVNFGSVAENWNYYCSYNAFSNVKVGDSVIITYQSPQEGYVSINSVSK